MPNTGASLGRRSRSVSPARFRRALPKPDRRPPAIGRAAALPRREQTGGAASGRPPACTPNGIRRARRLATSAQDAILPDCFALVRLDYGFFERREPQLFLDPLIHVTFGKFLGHADGVLDGFGVGAAVADDADAAHTQQRRAAVLGIVHAPLEIGEGFLGQQRSDAAGNGGFERLAQQVLHQVHQTFADLQGDIPDEAIANDHVYFAAVYVAAFYVANEVQVKILEERPGGTRQVVALVLFLANGENPHLRLGAAQHDTRVDLAHHGELCQHAR